MFSRRLATSALACALPFALAACGEKAPSDPRTEVPLVRTAIVQRAVPASRSFTGPSRHASKATWVSVFPARCWRDGWTPAKRSGAASC